MGDIKGFLKVKRQPGNYRPVCERVKDFSEVNLLRTESQVEEQSSRCMDCGTPFCHSGCPIGNYIPEWNDLVFHNHWEKAFSLLSATNNLPEITGRICPAICEYACVLGINDDPVTIRENELGIIEYAFKNGLIKPCIPKKRTGKKIAVVGSGPAGLACADQLNSAGHRVVVFERDDAVGGILRYGIPEFKLDKRIIERRIKILEKEGIKFKTKINIGIDYKAEQLAGEFDAVCIACGSRTPRDLNIEGRGLSGIHFAMDYLIQSNMRIKAKQVTPQELIDAKAKRVVVIGGGDTGADCVGVAHRQGASCVMQIEIMPKPLTCRGKDYPWPKYPLLLKSSTSHEEGGERDWSILTKKFIGIGSELTKLCCVRVEFKKDAQGCTLMQEIAGSDFEIEADLAILALGFLHPEKKGLIQELDLDLDQRGNVKTDERFMTSRKNVFACGDMRRGQSLIVWAIAEGRRAAHHIDKYLMKQSSLPAL
ncbi:MAG: glutamate synthase subunit beta [Candidatus Omnitrophica bacterium]|nr:glutamate synthase subunit beta [Candidatus Omnitrophota bacterium]MDD5690363.1 glutamate synthase subunit beta [Candidatus Omnitrophota bacterium]